MRSSSSSSSGSGLGRGGRSGAGGGEPVVERACEVVDPLLDLAAQLGACRRGLDRCCRDGLREPVDACRERFQRPEALLQQGNGLLGLGGARWRGHGAGELGTDLADHLLEGGAADEVGGERPRRSARSGRRARRSCCRARHAPRASSARRRAEVVGEPLDASVRLGGRRSRARSGGSAARGRAGRCVRPARRRCAELVAGAHEVVPEALELLGEVLHARVGRGGAVAELTAGEVAAEVLDIVGELVDAAVRLGRGRCDLGPERPEVACQVVDPSERCLGGPPELGTERGDLLGEVVDPPVRLGDRTAELVAGARERAR